jgi:N-succinyldiaminopimelate aminotransferase
VNGGLDTLLPYPFERLNALKAGVVPRAQKPHIALSIGEPKHAPPDFIVAALAESARITAGLGAYPATRGSDALRSAIADWAIRRFRLNPGALTPDRHVLPVNGTREALFSFGQAVLSGAPNSVCVMPNPFYQIYEGAALLRGARPWFVACPAENGHQPDYTSVPEHVWRRCELVYLCSPGNPTGAVAPIAALEELIRLADRWDFVIAADECYSEIYPYERTPPPGLLEVCTRLGRDDFARCVVFHSLSKRSNVPGLRSGFVAGDARILDRYFLYRTYHGCAMPGHVQEASRLAWRDEAHVVANRALYRKKFDAVTPIVSSVLEVEKPEAGFYLWPRVPARTRETNGDDESFARELFAAQNVTVLPGTYLAREQSGVNPGKGRVRMALVASLEECVEAAERIVAFVEDGRG